MLEHPDVYAFRHALVQEALYRELLPQERTRLHTPETAARARVPAARGQALMLISRFAESRASCEEAIAIALRVGARAEEGHARNTLGFALACLGEPDRGVAELETARRIADEVGDLDDLARAYLNLSELLVGPLNLLDDGLALALEGVEVTGRLGLAQDYGVSLAANAANALYSLGRWDEAVALLATAERQHPIGWPRSTCTRPAPRCW